MNKLACVPLERPQIRPYSLSLSTEARAAL